MNIDAFLGIDGGGTGSRAILVEADGNLLTESEGGPLNPYVVSPETFEANLRQLVTDLLKGVKPGRILGVGAGLAGVRTAGEQEPVRACLARLFPDAGQVRVTHDLDAALRGATSAGEGVVVVAGTGSAAYGRWKSREVLVGGWGSLLGDEGSGYWMGLQALRAVVRAEDGRDEGTALREAILTHLNLQIPRDLVPWSGRASKAEVAALSEVVLACRAQGDRPAQMIVEAGSVEIARLARTAAQRLGAGQKAMEIALTGGLMHRGSAYFAECRERIVREVPGAVVIHPGKSAVWGAVQLAMKDNG
jgi:N-acetylglucosamine kinase-like BadF-type ATPase